MSKPWEKPSWKPETFAVAYIRAIREKRIIIRRNKWRPDPRLSFENHKFGGYIGAGQYGSVLEVVNTETNEHYALKLQFELAKFNPADLRPEYSLEPPATASSEATKSSSQSVERRSLRAKRHRETRAYLRYIRTGHPNICNLEAFVQYTPEYSDGKDNPAMGLYFEYCDVGNLESLSNGFRVHHSKPPELFIWQVFYELASGLAFLHNQHPDYNTKHEHKNREAIFQDDIHWGNVFLKWGPDREGGYPHVKIGDFGISYTVPKGGHIPDPEYEEPDHKDPAWEPIDTKIKNEVWWVARTVYELARSGVLLDPVKHYNLAEQRRLFNAMDPIDGHLSSRLDLLIRSSLIPDPEKKPRSGELYRVLKGAFERRVGLMYRKLPDWVGEEAVTHIFDDKRLKELDEGGLEIELAAYEQSQAISALAHTRFGEFIDSVESLDEGEFEAMRIKIFEQVKQEIEGKQKKNDK
ncbi:hypothetical protein NHQ30_009951 [Ciborinia camelliae]|nr:hypothetical protein NHQ30_009951 [Ciborinia camelliae]